MTESTGLAGAQEKFKCGGCGKGKKVEEKD
jgi:hypothetical protein